MVKFELLNLIEKSRSQLSSLQSILLEILDKNSENKRLQISVSDVERCLQLCLYFSENDFELSSFNLDRALVRLVDSIERNNFGLELSKEYLTNRDIILSEIMDTVVHIGNELRKDKSKINNSEEALNQDSFSNDSFYFKERFTSSEDYVNSFEEKFQISIPSDYKSFLLKYGSGIPVRNHYYKELENGGVYDFMISSFYGNSPKERAFDLGNSFLNTCDIIPEGYLCISDDGIGNFVAIGMEGEKRNKIFILMDEEEEFITNVQLLEHSLNDFIQRLK